MDFGGDAVEDGIQDLMRRPNTRDITTMRLKANPNSLHPVLGAEIVRGRTVSVSTEF
jgi:hypothetical protein